MDVVVFGKGLVLGVAIAAPLGPIGALCINRTLERGFWAGVAGGLGTAIADGAYASLAAVGFTAMGGLLSRIELPLQIFGGLFLLYLGWAAVKPRGAVVAARVDARGLLTTTVATFLLTIANPATILSFAAIFAGLGLAAGADGWSAALLVIGVVFGSLSWWFFLSGMVSLLRARLPTGFVVWVSWISGGVLLLFGLASLGMAANAML